ncbi:pinin [Coccinella septempunctata]|uniref:pinin n=1 Tax=Coccinella septempunctata TaxID=41139 RepID=UPI001D082768|nr:pinin [Coccinella septempunctata]
MTDILKSFSTLQSELDVARSTLKGVDENIKRLIGRDPSDVVPRPQNKRSNPQNEERGRPRIMGNQNEERRFKNSRLRSIVQENEEPPFKKRNTNVSVFKRLSDRPVQENNQMNHTKGMISKVIVTPKEFPSRQERMEAQSKDAGSVARNRRMFGALLGTLQKFQQEETKLKTREEKRAQLEKKIEEHEIKEKEEIKKERQELFFNRKKKQAEIKMIELKMLRMKEYAAWEDSQKHRMNFIYTKTKPRIHFLPRKLNDAHKAALENSKAEIQSIMDKKREQVQEELQNIEERGKRMFESRKFQQFNKEQETEEHSNENDMDDDALDHLDDIQKEEENGLKQLKEESTEDTKFSDKDSEEKENHEKTENNEDFTNDLNGSNEIAEANETHGTENTVFENIGGEESEQMDCDSNLISDCEGNDIKEEVQMNETDCNKEQTDIQHTEQVLEE